MYAFRKMGILGSAAVLVILGGCMQTGGTRTASGSSHHCSVANMSFLGSLVGAALDKGHSRIPGATIGAGIGAFACMAYNYQVSQIRNASEVEQSYKSKHEKLPTNNTVASYDSQLLPGQTVHAGSNATMQSKITVVHGTAASAPQLKQQLILVSPEGKQVATVTKNVKQITDTGEYETKFVFSLPKGIQDGRYTVRSTLYMDGSQVRTNSMPMLVVS